MPTLLDITDDMQALDDLLTECGGDISDPDVAADVENWFSELENDFQNKADAYAALITEMTERAEVRKKQADRMASRARTDLNNAAFLKSRMLGVMQRIGMKNIDTDRFRISVANNGGKLPLEYLGAVPQEWMREPVSPGPDNERIRAALDNGDELPFAQYGERGQRLNIR